MKLSKLEKRALFAKRDEIMAHLESVYFIDYRRIYTEPRKTFWRTKVWGVSESTLMHIKKRIRYIQKTFSKVFLSKTKGWFRISFEVHDSTCPREDRYSLIVRYSKL